MKTARYRSRAEEKHITADGNDDDNDGAVGDDDDDFIVGQVDKEGSQVPWTHTRGRQKYVDLYSTDGENSVTPVCHMTTPISNAV